MNIINEKSTLCSIIDNLIENKCDKFNDFLSLSDENLLNFGFKRLHLMKLKGYKQNFCSLKKSGRNLYQTIKSAK